MRPEKTVNERGDETNESRQELIRRRIGGGQVEECNEATLS